MKVIAYGLLALLLMSGCVRRVRHIPVEPASPAPQQTETSEQNRSIVTGKLYNTSQAEARYNLKPEPFSAGSKETDPELLGPQRTIEKADISSSTPVAATKPAVQVEPIPQPSTAVTPISTPSVSPVRTSGTNMSRSECISMIGVAKFQRYSKRFGGETGAIKRCAILKKLKRG